MNREDFKKFTKYVVKRNVSKRVDRVLAHFDENNKKLLLTYYINGIPTEEDEDDLELTCAEILGEYPDIQTAETHCISSEKFIEINKDYVVYSRNFVNEK